MPDSAHDDFHDVHAEHQDELDAVPIEDNGEPLVDFLELCPQIAMTPTHPVFEFPRVPLLRRSVAEMLKDASRRVPVGLQLQVVEGYRPLAVQRQHFKHSLEQARKRFPDADEAKILMEAGRYSAPPDAKTPPPHYTGGAVDVTLINATGSQLDFISPYEMFDMRHATMKARGLSLRAEENRALLRDILEPTGLTNYADEWWHWSYGDNGWALRVGAKAAIYDRIELPQNVRWIGDLSKLPSS